MVEKLKTPFLSRATKETVTPFEKSKWDNTVIGFDSGLKETLLSYANTVRIEREAKNQWENLGESEITEELYNDPSFSLKVPGLEWQPYFTYEMLYEALDAQHASQRFQNAEGGFFSMKTLGAFGGAMIDPVNLIPAPVGLFGKSILKTAALIGSMNAGIELAISPTGYKAYAARGMEGEYNVYRNMAFAFVLGGMLGAAGPSLGKFLSHARAMNLPENAGNVAMRKLGKSFANIDSRLRTLIDQNRLEAPVRITGVHSIDFNTAGTHFIDSRGNLTTTAPIDPHVKVVIDDLGNIKVSGDMPTIVRSADEIIENKAVTGLISFGDIKNNKKTLTSKSSLDETSFSNVIDGEGGDRSFDKNHKLDDKKNSGLEIEWTDDFKNIKSITRWEINKKGEYSNPKKVDAKEFDALIDTLGSKIERTKHLDQKKTRTFDEEERIENQQRTDDVNERDSKTKNMSEEDADITTILGIKMKWLKKLPLSNKEADNLLYHSTLKNSNRARQLRLGYDWNEATQTLKRTTPAKDLNAAEVFARKDIETIDKKYKAQVKEEDGTTRAMNCGNKKGI